MSSISLLKPLGVTAAAPTWTAEGRGTDRVQTASVGDQDRSVAANDADRLALFWKLITALAIGLLIYNVVGMAMFGSGWIFACWDAMEYWCNGGYCR